MYQLRRTVLAALALFVFGAVAAIPTKADFFTYATPTAPYTSSTNLIPVGNPGTTYNSISDVILTVGFSSTLTAAAVPSETWRTWGSPPNTEGNMPRVLFNVCEEGCGSLTMTLDQGVSTFGFEMEPNDYQLFHVTVQFYNGANLIGMIGRDVNGYQDALLFAGYSTTDLFTSIVMTSDDPSGLAIARLRYTPGGGEIPEPTTLLLLGTGLAGLAARARKRRTLAA